MQKVYRQSRWQNIIYRMNQSVLVSMSVIIGVIIAATFNLQQQDSYQALHIYIVLFALLTVWLAVFNTGKEKLIEHGVDISDYGISYINYGEKETMSWQNYHGFEISSAFLGLFRTVILK